MLRTSTEYLKTNIYCFVGKKGFLAEQETSTMPTDPEQLRPLFEEIQRSLDTFEKGGDFPDHNERLKLISAAEKLAIAAREPEENLYYTATQVYYFY